jgi:predicted nucleic acid-binding protein
MKYVLDASVALKWVLPEKDTSKAVLLRNAYRQSLHELMAPDIFPAEIAHALAKNVQAQFPFVVSLSSLP